MTVEADIVALLGPLVGSRVFPDVADFATPRPYITYQQIGGNVLAFLGREVPSKEHGLFQINVWSETRTEAKALIKQAEAAFITATAFQASPVSAPISSHDPDLARYGALQDFSVWSER